MEQKGVGESREVVAVDSGIHTGTFNGEPVGSCTVEEPLAWRGEETTGKVWPV